jgi:hypothetical protein
MNEGAMTWISQKKSPWFYFHETAQSILLHSTTLATGWVTEGLDYESE